MVKVSHFRPFWMSDCTTLLPHQISALTSVILRLFISFSANDFFCRCQVCDFTTAGEACARVTHQSGDLRSLNSGHFSTGAFTVFLCRAGVSVRRGVTLERGLIVLPFIDPELSDRLIRRASRK